MSREMKFRAFDKEKKIMVHDFDQSLSVHYPQRLTPGASIHSLVWDVGLGYGTLMQYTGLKDKNGKEIYEGDILKHNDKLIEVKYEDEYAGFNICYQLCECILMVGDIEVIGNIHQNPDSIPQTALL